MTHRAIARQLERLYEVLDVTARQKKEAQTEMCRLGRRYPEIREFQKIPGVGQVIAHVFDAYIQTPDRFASKQKLWRYCKLGIKNHESGGRRISGEHLDKAGHGELKAHSCYAFRAAMRIKKDNEVRRFYEASLGRTGSRVHARLNTQRKIILTIWTIWRKKLTYNPEKFIGSAGS